MQRTSGRAWSGRFCLRVHRCLALGASSLAAGIVGHCGFNSDGIPATQSLLFNPSAVAIDSAGNLYIADVFNARIRKVDSEGTTSTVAGTGNSECGPPTGDGGPATAAPLCVPVGVALD